MDSVTKNEYEQIKKRISHFERELAICKIIMQDINPLSFYKIDEWMRREERYLRIVNRDKLLLERYQNAKPLRPKSNRLRNYIKKRNAQEFQEIVEKNNKEIAKLLQELDTYVEGASLEKNRHRLHLTGSARACDRKIRILEMENRQLGSLEPSGLSKNEIIQLTEYKLPFPVGMVSIKVKKLTFWDNTVDAKQGKRVAIWVLTQENKWKYLRYELADGE